MTNKLTKILIANRGEIACRIIRTAKKMGIPTVAVYSDADRDAVHVHMADEAIFIGPSPATESYLLADKILRACEETGADAVHPGYGFLSENPSFVRACQKAGINFIGPSPESMEAMGLKDAAKKLMDKANVPITPGYHGEAQDPEHLQKQADKIGYPVLIKAVAGGGGKGMRKVDDAKDFISALASCQREAKSSFGDDRVLIEKYISSPRHIEVQVFGDKQGNVIHLYERDCSLQRRHQKVIEEAPAPGMTHDVRKAMTDAAIKAAKAVNYIGAGTVEFIVDGSDTLKTDGFWFMEMNTRLQVEHPVTEMITGLDLVEWQIRVARGESLPEQSCITLSGHAFEARLYAEDPANDFLPSVGKLDILNLPQGHRVDTGVEQGGEVSIFYDPMISKIIVHAGTRREAIGELGEQCRQIQVYPVKTNARFLANCLNHADFMDGKVSTHFIAKYIDQLVEAEALANDTPSLAHAYLKAKALSTTPYMDGWRLNLPKASGFMVSYQDEDFALPLTVSPTDLKAHIVSHDRPEGQVIFVDGLAYLLSTASGNSNDGQGGNSVSAPMPGKIIALSIKSGDTVKADDALIVMEAMKMEMTLVAPRDGVIDTVETQLNALVADGDILLTLKEDS